MDKINRARLENCMRRAMRGERLTIGFFGGSITQGSLATRPEYTYAYRVFCWWKQTFPEAELHYVNGGIGGTTSHFGGARAVEDMLMYQPDFVVIDFSVNDDADSFFQETYEGLLRRMLTWSSEPALLILNNVFYKTGCNAQEYHNALAGRYGIPFVSIKDTIYRKLEQGKYTLEELTPDGLHPNDLGHRLVAEEIIRCLEKIRTECIAQEPDAWAYGAAGKNSAPQKTGCASERKNGSLSITAEMLPEPLTQNAYENAERLTIQNCRPLLRGFYADPEEKKGHLDFFKNGWIGTRPGDRAVFETEASCISVQFRKTIRKPARRAELILDGDRQNPYLLDGNFEEDWGDCLFLQPVLIHGEKQKHTLEITILPDEYPQAEPFYLLSLIIA